MAINRKILREKLSSVLCDRNKLPGNHNSILQEEFPNYLIQVIKDIIFNDPTISGIFKGKNSDYDGLPKTKSLFYTSDGCGLPIGNLTSQLFSNIYLNDFDHFVKEELGVKYYGRYVDDFVIIHKDKSFLKALVPKIKDYLKEKLLLDIHPNKLYLQPVHHGVEFLGTRIFPFYIQRSSRSLHNFYESLKQCRFKPKNESSLNSYLGLFIHYKQFRKINKMVKKLNLSKLSKISDLLNYYLKN